MSTQTNRLNLSLAGYEVVHRRAGVTLRYYPPGTRQGSSASYRTPVVLIAPLGVDVSIYDQRNRHSLVAYLSARDFDVYLIDWGAPGYSSDRRCLADYFAALLPEFLARVRFHSGHHQLLLHGWRMGGLFALCHAALRPASELAGLVLLDTCIDYQAAPAHAALQQSTGQGLQDWRRWAALRAARWKAHSPTWPRWMQNLAQQAVSELTAGEDAISLYSYSYSSGVMADIVDYLWNDNVLAHGQLPMVQTDVDLSAVQVPLLCIEDISQSVCSPGCTQLLQRHVGSRDFAHHVVDEPPEMEATGALLARQSWPAMGDWLARHAAKANSD